MPNLFGIDIAGVIGDALRGQLVPGVLTKVTPSTRTPGSLISGTNPTTTSHSFEGFIENRDEVRIPGQLQTVSGQVVTLITASVAPTAEPAANDKVTIEGTEFDVIAIVGRDPAAATFELLVQA